jgi:hypothetical protein
MPRVKTHFSKVYDVPRRPFEKERLDQVSIKPIHCLNPF